MPVHHYGFGYVRWWKLLPGGRPQQPRRGRGICKPAQHGNACVCLDEYGGAARDIGTFDGPVVDSFAEGINNSNQVVGYSYLRNDANARREQAGSNWTSKTQTGNDHNNPDESQ